MEKKIENIWTSEKGTILLRYKGKGSQFEISPFSLGRDELAELEMAIASALAEFPDTNKEQ